MLSFFSPKGPAFVSSGHQDSSSFFKAPWPLAPRWLGGLQRAKQAGVVPLTQLEVGGTEGLLVDVDFPNPTEKVSFELSEISC